MSDFVDAFNKHREDFIANTSCLRTGVPYTRVQTRQLQALETQLPPERAEITINQPVAAETYYKVCGKIDQHNRSWHDNLMMEKKIQTKDWSLRVNLSIFAMIVVDTCYVYKKLKGREENKKTFYTNLAEELVDNKFDQVRRRARAGQTYSPDFIRRDGLPRSGGTTAHLTPTKRKRNKGSSRFLGQGRCCM